MPIQSNRFFNSPYMAQAAGNLAELFAPPSGTDEYGYARAKGAREEAKRLQWLFNNSMDPTASHRSALTGVQGFDDTPAGFMRSDETERRGQDVSAGADLGVARINNAGALQRQFAEPVAVNEDQRVFLPQQTQDATGLMEVLEGNPSPLSETEWKASQGQRLYEQGDLTDEALLGIIGGDTKQTNAMAVLSDGRQVPAIQDGTTGRWRAAQTGEELPADVRIFDTPKPQGSAEEVGVTNSTLSSVQQSEIAGQKFENLLTVTRDLSQDPTNFGLPGVIKGVAQDATALANGLAQGLGFTGMQDAVTDVQRSAVANGVSPALIPGVFDPNLPALQTTTDLLVYHAASALAGQEGRAVSDRDVQIFKGIVGDPRSWLMSQERFLAKLDQLERILGGTRKVDQTILEGGNAADAGISPTESAAPSAPTSSGGSVERWERGPDGLRRVQ